MTDQPKKRGGAHPGGKKPGAKPKGALKKRPKSYSLAPDVVDFLERAKRGNRSKARMIEDGVRGLSYFFDEVGK